MKFGKQTKKDLIQVLCKKVECKLKEKKEQLAKLRQAASEAPGAMQSQHDGFKAEFNRLAENTEEQISKLEKELKFLQDYEVKDLDKDIVMEGSLVEIQDPNKRIYFILPVCGGENLTFGDENIIVVTLETPLGSILLNKKNNFLLNFRDKNISIINIY